MRIGISTSVIQRGKTGVAQHVFALLKALLPRARPQHQLLAFVLEEDQPLFSVFAKEGLEVVPVPERFRPPVKNIWWHQTVLPNLVRRKVLDVLHVPSYRRMLWPRPCPLVATIHDLAPFRVPQKYDWKRMFYGKVIVKRLARRQDRIIAISQNTADDIARFFLLPESRITVIPNGIDHERFNPGAHEEARSRVTGRHGFAAPFFLYVARLEHPGKNHLRLISAFEEFKAGTHSPWLLALGGSDWHGAEVIHEAIRRSRFSADIRCLGFVPDSDLPDLYRAADVFVYPSLYEGFGLPPLEAMACGCPVIASPRGSLREVLADAAAFIEPEDVHSMARELFILATDSAARNKYRAAGLSRAREFDWSSTAADTLSVYEDVARRS